MAYGFSRNDHRRVSNVVRTFENSPLGKAAKGKNVSISDPARRGITTSTITAREEIESGKWTPGTGTAKFYDYDRDTNELTLSDEYEIKNDQEVEFADDGEAYFYWRGGFWWIVLGECP